MSHYGYHEEFRVDDQIVKEILKFAHKLPSPRSVVDEQDDNIPSTDVSKVTEMAFGFLMRIVELSKIVMQSRGFQTAICQCFVAEALEQFVKIDYIGHRFSYMLDNDDSDDSSADSEWREEDMSDDDDSQESDDDLEENIWDFWQNDSDEDFEDEEEEEEEDEQDCDDEEDDDHLYLTAYGRRVAAQNVETPTFDAVFTPISAKKIKVSNDDFRQQIYRLPIGNAYYDFRSVYIPDNAVEKFKVSMYSYIVANLK